MELLRGPRRSHSARLCCISPRTQRGSPFIRKRRPLAATRSCSGSLRLLRRRSPSRNRQHPSTGASDNVARAPRKTASAGRYAGGNFRDYTVETLLRNRPVYVSFREVPVETANGVRWRVAPGSGTLAFEQNGSLWRIVATGGDTCPYPDRARVCARVPRSGTLLAVGGGRLLVRTTSGVLLLRQDGSVVATYPAASQGVTDGTRVVELTNGRLTSGSRSISVPRSARAGRYNSRPCRSDQPRHDPRDQAA